jgi:transglutaminase-like putative cysteine protease
MLLLVLFVCLYSQAAEIKYPVTTIPEELKQNVDVVVRLEETSFKIITKSKAIFSVHEVYTILNAKGKRYAREVIGYDKLRKVNNFSGVAYDAMGNAIKKLKSSDIQDQSAYDGISLFSDARIKIADLSQAAYPYTVEFEYEVEYKFLFYIPPFAVLSSERVSLEKSIFTLVYPKELEPRYKSQNISSQPVKANSNNLESLMWSFENVKPLKYEPFGPPPNEIVSVIYAAPSQFSYEGYEGNMNSWLQYGQFINSLNNGRDVLPEATKAEIQKLTSSLKTTEEKARAVYQYLQNKTRYVSIQLGIGGHQPFEAQVVDNTGYGDCKALSNYTVAMLNAAGIRANYTLISAGADEPDIITDFPSTQFNHVIVSVPNNKDTLWLECTNQTNPFGYLGTFTGDRHALMITEQGGKLVKTPSYALSQNTEARVADVTLDKTGNAKATVRTTFSGLKFESGGLSRVVNYGADDQKKWIQEYTDIPSFDIATFSMTNKKDKIPSATVNVNYVLNRYATISGKRIFFSPNLMNRSTYIPEKIENRKTEVVLRTPYTEVDTIRYTLPEDVYPEFMPEPFVIKSKFGEYQSSFKVDQGSLIYIRRLKMNKGTYPPESYQELIDFYKNMNKADNLKMVFVSKT